MFDIHSHIIYGVDDGSRDLNESVELVKCAAGQGVKDIIATPHYDVNHTVDKETVLDRLDELRNQLKLTGVEDVNLYPGQEILYFDSMTELLKEGRLLTLAESRLVLVEFYVNESYSRIEKAVMDITRSGYRPVIAHIERIDSVRARGVKSLIDKGAYIQVNTGSITGTGPFAALNGNTAFARSLLRTGDVHFLGSDMHSMDGRPPVVSGAVKYIKAHCKKDYAEELIYNRAMKQFN